MFLTNSKKMATGGFRSNSILNAMRATFGSVLNLNQKNEESEESNKEMFVQNECTEIKDEEEIKVYQPKLKKIFEDGGLQIRKFSIGTENPGIPERVVLFVGGTGSGKTTMINGMFNYILGVDWDDDYRFKLIVENPESDAYSVTTYVTAYTIHHRPWFKVPYTFTIVDTPGFGDTSGIARDKLLIQQLKNFFLRSGKEGIDRLDAVGFVQAASTARLDATHRYIFDSVLQVFGKDIRENIFMLLTFADGQKPLVLDALKKAEIPYIDYFRFNNSALYISNAISSNSGDEEMYEKVFWSMGFTSFRKFMSHLDKVKGKSLTLTSSVLHERRELENSIESFYQEIKMGLGELDKVAQEIKVLKDHEADIARNKKFKYTVREHKITTQPTEPGQYTTNCTRCNVTCHKRCAFSDDQDKKKCIAMDPEGNCKHCKEKCAWNLHRNHPYVYVVEMKEVEKTDEDLKMKYEKALQGKISAEQLVRDRVNDFKNLQKKVMISTERSRNSINRLSEIALKPHSLSLIDYIDLLVTGEKTEQKPGWSERMTQLYKLKESVQYEHKLMKGDYDPFREEIDKHNKTEDQEVWARLKKFLSPRK